MSPGECPAPRPRRSHRGPPSGGRWQPRPPRPPMILSEPSSSARIASTAPATCATFVLEEHPKLVLPSGAVDPGVDGMHGHRQPRLRRGPGGSTTPPPSIECALREPPSLALQDTGVRDHPSGRDGRRPPVPVRRATAAAGRALLDVCVERPSDPITDRGVQARGIDPVPAARLRPGEPPRRRSGGLPKGSSAGT
jgi:hypothetical protein